MQRLSWNCQESLEEKMEGKLLWGFAIGWTTAAVDITSEPPTGKRLSNITEDSLVNLLSENIFFLGGSNSLSDIGVSSSEPLNADAPGSNLAPERKAETGNCEDSTLAGDFRNSEFRLAFAFETFLGDFTGLCMKLTI